MIEPAQLPGLALRNDVQTTLAADVLPGDTSLQLVNAAAPYANPPEPGTVSVLTLTNSITQPTTVEVVTYTTVTDNGDGTMTVGGVTRGQEGTTPAAFNAGQFVYQAITAGLLSAVMRVAPEMIEANGAPEPGFLLAYDSPGMFRWVDPDPPLFQRLNLMPFEDASLDLHTFE